MSPYSVFVYVIVRVVDCPSDSRSRNSVKVSPLMLSTSPPKAASAESLTQVL